MKHAYKHENQTLEAFFDQKTTSGDRKLHPASVRAQAYSALDEWHASPKKLGNLAHFKMVLSGAHIPNNLIEKIVKEESHVS